jgi:hypothetical protein
VCLGVSAPAGRGPFSWFKAAGPPADWEALALPTGSAVLFAAAIAINADLVDEDVRNALNVTIAPLP